MKKPLFFVIVLALTIIMLSVVQITVSNTLSTKGVVLGKFDEEISSYKKENYIIREKLLIISSLSTIASRASELGFVDNKFEIVINKSLMIAVKQ